MVRLPIEKPLSALDTRASEVTPILVGVADPFLYNPRKVAAGHVGVVKSYRTVC